MITYKNFSKCIKDLMEMLKDYETSIDELMTKINKTGLKGKLNKELRKEACRLRSEVNLTLISIWSGCRFEIDPKNKNDRICAIPFWRKYSKGEPEIIQTTEKILNKIEALMTAIKKSSKSRGSILNFKNLPKSFASMSKQEFNETIIDANISTYELSHLNKLRREYSKEIWKKIAIYSAIVIVIGVGISAAIHYIGNNESAEDKLAEIAVPDIDSIDFSEHDAILDSMEESAK